MTNHCPFLSAIAVDRCRFQPPVRCVFLRPRPGAVKAGMAKSSKVKVGAAGQRLRRISRYWCVSYRGCAQRWSPVIAADVLKGWGGGTTKVARGGPPPHGARPPHSARLVPSRNGPILLRPSSNVICFRRWIKTGWMNHASIDLSVNGRSTFVDFSLIAYNKAVAVRSPNKVARGWLPFLCRIFEQVRITE